jgi:hypothetical protein
MSGISIFRKGKLVGKLWNGQKLPSEIGNFGKTAYGHRKYQNYFPHPDCWSAAPNVTDVISRQLLQQCMQINTQNLTRKTNVLPKDGYVAGCH